MKNPQSALARAQKDFRRLAARGHAFAMCNLGMMYENGQSVPRNHAEAARWYERGAEKDDPACLIRLGILLANGRGVPRNRVKALRCFFRAAELGEAESAQRPAAQTWARMDDEERSQSNRDAPREPGYACFLEKLAAEPCPAATVPDA